MFERFTEKAIKVIMLAQEEARRLGHNFVGTEQILLGLVGEGTGIAARVLKAHNVRLKEARKEVEKIIGRGSGFIAVEIPYTPRGRRVLELAWDEARNLGHNYIGTEHLLLELVREGEGVAARVLENLGVDLTKVRQSVIDALNLKTVAETPIPQVLNASGGDGSGGAIVSAVNANTMKVINLSQEEAELAHSVFGMFRDTCVYPNIKTKINSLMQRLEKIYGIGK